MRHQRGKAAVGLVFVAAAVVSLGATRPPAAAATSTRASVIPSVDLGQPLGSAAGSLPAGPRANGTAVLPDGRIITPVGNELEVQLQPLNEVLSHDGTRLYVSSEGIDDDPTTATLRDGTHKRFLTVVDTRTNRTEAEIRDDALHYGMAEARDGSRLYVSEGATDSIGVITRAPGAPDHFTIATGAIRLDPAESQRHVYPWGLALSRDGKRLFAVGFSSNTLYTVDIDPADGAPHVIATAPTGQYPFAVTLSPDGRRLYVSNWGEFNPGVAEYETTQVNSQLNSPIVPPPATIGGYNTPSSSSVWTYDVGAGGPALAVETPIGNQLNAVTVDGASEPSALAVSPDGRTLAVTSSNDDLVELLDTTRTMPTTEAPSATGGLGSGEASLVQHPTKLIDLRVLGTNPTGAEPDAVAWAPDGRVLLVAEGGRNSVAVIDPAVPAVVGRLPTGWYPDGLAISADGGRVWILSDNGLGSGPNTDLGPDGQPIKATYADPTDPTHGGASDLAYIPNTLHGMVQEVDLAPACRALPALTLDSDRDNGLLQGAPAVDGMSQAALAGTGYVVPTGYGKPTSDRVQKIKHVFLILKENRPFDQVFGDVPGNERDARFTDFGKMVTPDAHYLAQQFASSDNYYVNSETSRDGHFAVDTGQVTEFLLKTVPSSYAGKIPFDAMDTNPENIPEGGFIWDNASRAGVKSRIYGEGTYVIGVAPTTLGALGTKPALNNVGALVPGISATNVSFDSLYPTQAPIPYQNYSAVYQYNDHARATEFSRDFGQELAPALGPGPLTPAEQTAADAVVPPLNVMILFDDHTGGDIGGAPFPRDYIAENDDALGQVVHTIATSPVWHDSAVFVTEDDTQGGQDSVDAHRSFNLVLSPWAKRPQTGPGYVSHVHTSFSSTTKTIDLLLGIPPGSLQELTATSLADDFVSGPGPGIPNGAVPVPQHETYGGGGFGYSDGGEPNPSPYASAPAAATDAADRNYTVANAPNATLRRAAEVALQVPPGIDQGGALAQYDLELEQEGLREAGDPSAQVSPVIEHTLESGSPSPVTLAANVSTPGPAIDTCVRAASAGSGTPTGSATPTGSGTPNGSLPRTGMPWSGAALALGAAALVVAIAIRRARRIA